VKCEESEWQEPELPLYLAFERIFLPLPAQLPAQIGPEKWFRVRRARGANVRQPCADLGLADVEVGSTGLNDVCLSVQRLGCLGG